MDSSSPESASLAPNIKYDPPYSYDYPPPQDGQYELSPEECKILQEAGLAVNEHVVQVGFMNKTHFFQRSNNFKLYFQDSDLSQQYRALNNVYKRFSLIRKDQAIRLIECYKLLNNSDRLEPEMLQDLYNAYIVMTALVDANDAYVIRQDKDGQETTDFRYLCR